MSFERTICKQVNYSKEIAPFPLVKIYSGVGSGKSYFAARMVLGAKEYGVPQQNVLIVTSRRSKVNETLKELGVAASEKVTKNGNLNYEVWKTGEVRPAEYEPYLKEVILSTDYGDFPYTTYNKSVVCTNAYISAYLRYVHDPDNPTTQSVE